MSQKLTISETGLKLIKAFEGYRPVDRELVTGQRIVGYGHRLYSEDAVMMNKTEAEEVLRSDLEPFEDMINSEVHAPISQSQFDALCSFAFNIGPRAFLQSDTLRALNNGRPLDAANGLDVWRKSHIAGKTYVVDALMRRRTAEKALFLRTERDLSAGREDLPPVKDTTIEGLSTEDAYPVFTEEDAKTIVTSAPYSAGTSPARRREDGPAGVLQLSELDIIENEDLSTPDALDEPADLAEFKGSDDALGLELNLTDAEDIALESSDLTTDMDEIVEDADGLSSPIAAAASDIVARLDALIDDADMGVEDRDADWPNSLLDAETLEDIEDELDTDADVQSESVAQIIDLESRVQRSGEKAADDTEIVETDIQIDQELENTSISGTDELAPEEAVRPRMDSAAKYIETSAPQIGILEPKRKTRHLGLWIPVILGFILLGVASGTMIRGSEALLGAWGPIIAFTGFVIGTGLIIAGIFAYVRNIRDVKHNPS